MPQNGTMIFYGPKGRSWALVAPGGSPEEGRTRQEAQVPLVGCAHLGYPPDRLFAL